MRKLAGSLLFLVALPILAEWRDVGSWTGQGAKETETFTVASAEWRVNWASRGEGVLSILVYSAENDLVSLAANTTGTRSDVSYVHAKPGRYYLKINSTNTWSVIVQDQK